MLKRIICGMLSVLLVGALAGCGSNGSDSGAKKDAAESSNKVVRVAIQPSATWAPLWYMKDQGTLEKALESKGIKVQWTEFQAGPPMNESFAAGQQDIGVGGDVPTIAPLANGQKNKIVAQGGKGDKIQAVIVGNDSGITSPSQLKGKTVGITVGSSAHHLLDSVLEKNGLTLQDVKIVNLTAGDAEAALLNKQVDAVAFWEPNITFLVDKHAGKFLVDQTGAANGGGPIFVTEKYYTDNKDVVKVFLEEYKKAAEYIKAHPEEVAPGLAKHYHCTPEQMVKILNEYEYPVKITDDDIKGLDATAKFMKKIGILSSDINIKDYIDSSIANSL